MALKIINANLKFASPLIPLDKNKVKFIVIHHPDAKLYSPEQIHQDHLKKGWNGAGYNEYIRKDGTVYILRGDSIGAQCENLNSKSYGICFEGDYDIEIMPEVQFQAGVVRIKAAKERFKNVIEVGPHSKYCATGCPGKLFPLAKMIQALSAPQGLQEFYAAVEYLNHTIPAVISSPEYWTLNAVKGKQIPGELAEALIVKTARYIQNKSK